MTDTTLQGPGYLEPKNARCMRFDGKFACSQGCESYHNCSCAGKSHEKLKQRGRCTGKHACERCPFPYALVKDYTTAADIDPNAPLFSFVDPDTDSHAW